MLNMFIFYILMLLLQYEKNVFNVCMKNIYDLTTILHTYKS